MSAIEVTASHRSGSGSPLVLLHGFTDTWRAWQPVLPALEAEHEVFAPTLPGHHGGPAVPDGWAFTIPAMIDLVERQLDDAGIETAHLAGNSLGGWVAMHLAARGRARSVVGICPAGGWEHNSRDGRRIVRFFQRTQATLRFGRPLFEQIAARPRARALAMRDAMAHPDRIPAAAALAMFRGAAGCTIYSAALATARRDGLGELEEIDCPVRIAYGTRDRLIRWPVCFERFHEFIPDAEWIPLEGAGHIAMWDTPDLVARTILELTARVDAAVAVP